MDLDYIIESTYIPNDLYVIVGVSAGPDSMALLHLLQKNLNKKLVCTHINHNVRKESNQEEEYLKNYCKKNNIIFESYKIKSYNEKNFENEARKIRYDFYEKMLKKYKSHSLYLAHHGDDLIETILMKINRGSNLEGYAGIKKYSNVKDYTIIRPLLSVTKNDLINYNIKNNIVYYNDESNEDTTYTRNRIRKNILPILKQESKDIHLKYLKYSETLQDYYNYIEKITLDKINKNYNNNTIDIEKFKKEDKFIQKNIIFYILSKIYNDKDNTIKNIHIENIINLIYSKYPNKIISLPKNYYVKKTYNYIYIEKGKKNIQEEYNILFDNICEINEFKIKIENNILNDGNNICRLNSKEIKLPLYIRNKKNGDKIEVLGLNGNKKISDIFIENKIPKDIRKRYPILVDSNDKVLWVPNLKKSKYNKKRNELYDIILSYYTKGGDYIEKEKK